MEDCLFEDSSPSDEKLEKEHLLREWVTRDCDTVRKIIDGLDIGWSGIQHWVVTRLHMPANGLRLDFACGYGTCLIQLDWQFPTTRLVGLNINLTGPYSLAKPLLAEAGVNA